VDAAEPKRHVEKASVGSHRQITVCAKDSPLESLSLFRMLNPAKDPNPDK